MTPAPYRAVIFDLGGVVLDSPLEVIAAHEAIAGSEPGSINGLVHRAGASGAWARHERGELDRTEFVESFSVELADAGVGVDVASMLRDIEESFRFRPVVVGAIEKLREQGLLVAALTNNWSRFTDDNIVGLFDVFVESVVEGVRKPEPEIYRRCVQRLGVEPSVVVMLDDLGPNLKPARDMGMTTIKVVDPAQAIDELSWMVGIALT